jgi:hypothetical protein
MNYLFKASLMTLSLTGLPAFAGDFDTAGDLKAQAVKYVHVENQDTLRQIKRVVIPSFMVDFVSELNYSKNLSGLEAVLGADSDVSLKLVGADQARFQAITNALYEKTVAQLQASGVEVVSNAELQASPEHVELSAKGITPLPSEQDAKAGKGLFFSAQNLPLYHMDEVSFIPTFQLFGKPKEDQFLTFGSRFSSGFSSGFNQQIEEKIAKKFNASVLKVRVTLLGGQLNPDKSFWSSGKVSTRAAASFADFVNRYAFITPEGKKARVSLKETVTTGDVGELVNVTSSGTKATDTVQNAAVLAYNVAAIAGRFTGVSAPTINAYSSTSHFEYRVEPDVFEQKVVADYSAIAGMFMHAVQTNK